MLAQTCSICGRQASMRVGVEADGRATYPCPGKSHDLADRAWQILDWIVQLADAVEDCR